MKYVNNIINVLKENDKIAFVILFGSQIKNKTRFGGDLDLAIYFKSEPSILELGDLYNKLEKIIGIRIDLVKLNNLYETNPELAFNIMNEGKLILSNDTQQYKDYKRRVILRYMDVKPMLDKIHAEFLERLFNNNFAS